MLQNLSKVVPLNSKIKRTLICCNLFSSSSVYSWSKLGFQEEDEVGLESPKEPSRKRPLLDLNLEDDPLSGSSSEKGESDESSGSGPSKR